VVVITGPVSDEIDRIPVGEAELFDVARVDEDDVATALDAAIAVAEPVDGGVVLVVVNDGVRALDWLETLNELRVEARSSTPVSRSAITDPMRA
jgi:hypothetical protein